MLTTAQQFRILAKMIGDLYELKKEHSNLWHYTCDKSVPDDYRQAMDGVMDNAKKSADDGLTMLRKLYIGGLGCILSSW